MDTKSKRKFKAQGAVEFAIVLPILMLIILGLIEFGRLMFIYAAATSAGREAARYGASVGDNGSGVARYLDCDGIRGAALRLGSLVGVEGGDVYIHYDEGPTVPTPTPPGGLPACPVTEDDIQLGDRIVIEVRGEYNPVPAAPFVNLPTWEFYTITRRTIVKEANVAQGGTAVGAIFTNTPVPTATNTGEPTATKTSTPTATGVPTDTPTPTPTPVPPNPPVFVAVDWVEAGNKCNNIELTWEPNADWTIYPGSSPVFYQTYKNGLSSDAVSPGDPGQTVWKTGDQLNHNTTIQYDIKAVFAGGLGSRLLTKSYRCWNGELQDTTAPPPVYVEIIVPTDGATITGPEQTEFEAIAHDPEVGTANGDGISEVQFELYDSDGNLIMARSEFVVRYCAFSGDSSCDQWNNQPTVGWSDVPNGTYTLRARAIADSGRVSDWVLVTFTISK